MKERSGLVWKSLGCSVVLLILVAVHVDRSIRHNEVSLMDRLQKEINDLERQKSSLDRDLLSAKHISVAKHKPASSKPLSVDDKIKKLESEKLAIEADLAEYHPLKVQTDNLQNRGSSRYPISSHSNDKRPEELDNLLRQQEALQDKIDSYDRVDDPKLAVVVADHYLSHPGLLSRVRNSQQNLMGSLAAVKDIPPPPATAPAAPAAAAAAATATATHSSQEGFAEDAFATRLERDLVKAIRAAAAQMPPADSAAPVTAAARRRAHALAEAAAAAAAPPAEDKPKEVNPEQELQALRKAAREWVGFKGGLAALAPPAPVLCSPLSPERFRGECHAEGYLPAVTVGPADYTGPDRFGAKGAGPQLLRGKLGDNVIGVGLLGEAGTEDDDNLLPVRLHEALAKGPSRDPHLNRFGVLNKKASQVLMYGSWFTNNHGMTDMDDHVPPAVVSSGVY